MTTHEDMMALALEDVWQQARENHERYSATGSQEDDIRFLSLGLVGEAGEVLDALWPAVMMAARSGQLANLVKKRWRDGDQHVEAIRYEIADVLAYAIMLADRMGMTPESLIATIAVKQQVFIRKMEARAAIQGGEG